MTTRRDFLTSIATGSAVLLGASRRAMAQAGGAGAMRGMHDSAIVRDSQNLFAMNQSAALNVTLPPKPNAKPVLTSQQRDDLVEKHLHCQCGCTLDVFTCRTTDFSCQVSPAMHQDVMALVQGGYDAQEIINAFTDVYGQRVLMAPRKAGFDLVAWVLPGAMVVAGAGALVMLIRRWGERAARPKPVSSVRTPAGIAGVDATPEELARLEAAIRGEDDQ